MRPLWQSRTHRGARLGAVPACALALALVAGAAAPGALAYFTTYVTAQGGYQVQLKAVQSTPTEEFANWTKTVVVTNDEASGGPCFVRARAYAGSQFGLSYQGDAWSPGADGWWYHVAPVAPGASTEQLQVQIDVPDGFTDDFNVTVVYETVAATEDSPFSAAWDAKLDVVSTTYGSEEA